MEKQIFADFDEQGIFVYQAFKPTIADEAVRQGTFGKGFNLERMTWIKPSFGWMLYRSGYATKHRQERILKIKLTHEGFQTIISQAIPTLFDPNIFTSEDEWRQNLQHSEVRYQWDPDRDLSLRKLERRALQIGIRGSIVQKYVNTWILGVEDVTELAHAIKATIEKQQKEMPKFPQECLYEVNPAIQKILGIK
ncbi:hypothetical protein NIES4074_24540 [Cylindrospermum sp. NIES-4074]|jgi:hypothetical protein|nr:hypothetical protein NIES4074_24540 [Cylindrospermum sp. NIES-4074]